MRTIDRNKVYSLEEAMSLAKKVGVEDDLQNYLTNPDNTPTQFIRYYGVDFPDFDPTYRYNYEWVYSLEEAQSLAKKAGMEKNLKDYLDKGISPNSFVYNYDLNGKCIYDEEDWIDW